MLAQTVVSHCDKKLKLYVAEDINTDKVQEKEASSSSASSLCGDETAADPPSPDDNDELDETYPSVLAGIEWQQSIGRKGCIHIILSDGSLACGRDLKNPERGIGLSQAFNTNRPISPRCYKALPNAGRRWWSSTEAV